jgi:hypothetical protein
MDIWHKPPLITYPGSPGKVSKVSSGRLACGRLKAPLTSTEFTCKPEHLTTLKPLEALSTFATLRACGRRR